MADDASYMAIAIERARLAGASGDVPIGAVVTAGDEVLAASANRREADRDPTAHAELLALREAARVRGDWRLTGCTLYVTLEPCAMCAGALVLARIDRLVYGVADPKAGAIRSLYNIADDSRLNHRLRGITEGVLEEECADLLAAFFEDRRRS